MSALRQFLISILVVGCFAGFYIGSALLSWLICPLLALGTNAGLVRIHRIQRAVQTGFRWFHAAMRGMGLADVGRGGEAIALPDGPCVIIANHPTLIDVTAILAAVGNTACVVKPALFRSFAIGRTLRYAGYINGGNGSAGDGAMVMREAEARLAQGMNVLIFPEGTRSPPGGLGRFRRGAFEIARRAHVPVVTLLLRSSPEFLTKQAVWYRRPTTVPYLTIEQLPLLDAAGQTGDSRAETHAVHAHYHQALFGIDAAVAKREDLTTGGD